MSVDQILADNELPHEYKLKCVMMARIRFSAFPFAIRLYLRALPGPNPTLRQQARSGPHKRSLLSMASAKSKDALGR